MKVDRRSFFAGAAALGATAPLGGLADEAQGASSAIRSHGFFARRKYDHVVVGGGFAGVAAALASATCLLERTNVLGGLSTQGHIIVFMPLCDGYGRQVTFGIPEELLRLPMKYSAAKPNGAWVDKKGTKAELSAARYELVFDPGPMMLGLERALVDAGVDIFYDCSAEKALASRSLSPVAAHSVSCLPRTRLPTRLALRLSRRFAASRLSAVARETYRAAGTTSSTARGTYILGAARGRL